jgi:hypothetical protein
VSDEQTPNPHLSNGYFSDEPPAERDRLGRGLIGHVRIVALLMIVQGVLELGFGALMLASGAMFLGVREPELAHLQGLAVLCLALSVPGIIGGILHLWAGPANWQFRRRKLGIAALGVGLTAMFTVYCAPTGIALAVYGLIVYLNDSVTVAFEMGEHGKSRADIDRAFPVDVAH